MCCPAGFKHQLVGASAARLLQQDKGSDNQLEAHLEQSACPFIVHCIVLCQVTELWQFFLVRMLTGISIGGCFPLVFSLLGDLFPVSQRAAMSAIVQIAIGGGIGGGQVGHQATNTCLAGPFVLTAWYTQISKYSQSLLASGKDKRHFIIARRGETALAAPLTLQGYAGRVSLCAWMVAVAVQMLAGLLGPATNWRLPFLVMATPTLLLAVLLLATVSEPPRGGK